MVSRLTQAGTGSSVDTMQYADLKGFLEGSPPGTQIEISDIVVVHTIQGSVLQTPDLQLDCENARCDGPRIFRYASPYFPPVSIGKETNFLIYLCGNCRVSTKTYALQYQPDEEGALFSLVKVGEWPPFGPRLPSKLISLIRDDRELFQKGRRAENQGMGIGAFAYYRRVVESQKNALIDQIVKVANDIGGMQEIVEELGRAKKEKQFSKAVEKMKHGIPESLLIKGHNPLLLLHNALSEGLHSNTDKECLKYATDIRLVLTEFSEKLSTELTDNKELDKAVKRLATKRNS